MQLSKRWKIMWKYENEFIALEALIEALHHSPRSTTNNSNGETEQDSPYHRSRFVQKHRQWNENETSMSPFPATPKTLERAGKCKQASKCLFVKWQSFLLHPMGLRRGTRSESLIGDPQSEQNGKSPRIGRPIVDASPYQNRKTPKTPQKGKHTKHDPHYVENFLVRPLDTQPACCGDLESSADDQKHPNPPVGFRRIFACHVGNLV